jgi:hypothetical protein
MGVGRVVVVAVAGSIASGCQDSPARVLDLIPDRGSAEEAPVVQVAAGAGDVCGLRADGTITCWGGRHGFRSHQEGSFVKVSGGCLLDIDGHTWPPGASEPDTALGAFAELSCGDYHACGIRDDRSVACWVHSEPERIDPLEPPAGSFVQVDTGTFFACGLGEDGAVSCFGDEVASARGYAPFGTFDAVAVGGFACAVDGGFVDTCWGGATNTTNGFVWLDAPLRASGGISVGMSRVCGLRSGGNSLDCWDLSGRRTSIGGAFDDVSAGGHQVCAVSEGQVLCWAPEPVGLLGYPCGHNAICHSGLCATSERGQFCTVACDPGEPCPPGFECLLVSGGARICWPDRGS